MGGALEAELRSELARRRVEARRAALQAERDLARAAHDLKAPLSALKGYVDMMLRGIAGPMPPTANRYLTRIREVVERERALIDDRLRQPARPAAPLLDFARTLGAAVERSSAALSARRVTLAFEAPPGGCPLFGDRWLVELLARRLVRHLLQVTPAGETARLALREDLGRRWIDAPGGDSLDLRVAFAAAARLGATCSGGAASRIDLPHDP